MNLTECIKAGDDTRREGYLIAFHYDENTIETLKSAIPHTERSYYPENQHWWVSIDYEDVLQGLFGNFDALAHWQGKLF